MKKLSLLLAMMLAVATFGGCGKDKNDDDDNAGSTKKSSVSEDMDSSDDDNSDKNDSSDDKKSDKSDSDGFSRGIITDESYTSEFGSINFELPDGWRFLSDDEIKRTMGVGLNAVGSDIDADTMTKASVYDCAACNIITGENLIFVYEDLSRYAADFSVKDYMKLAKLSLSSTMPGAEIEWEDENGQKSTLGGIEFDAYILDITLTDYNVSVKQEMYARQIGDYMLLITYSSGDPDSSMADIAGYFKE